jgi:type IV pilus assembly protein PilY1
MRRPILRVALLACAAAVIAAVVALPRSTTPQAPPDERAARTLLATNLADSLMHPPKAEDYDFFTSSGGVPNIFFVVDTSGSMERLPPDGPAFYGGESPTLPPGSLLLNRDGIIAQNSARNTRPIVGCGLDPVSAGSTAFMASDVVVHVRNRKFHTPCGKARNQALVGETYRGHPGLVVGGADYAYESSVCPGFTSSDPQKTGRSGWDPDYYRDAPNNNQIPTTLFADDLVFHDTVALGDDYDRNLLGFRHNFGNGWDSTSDPPTTRPYKKDNSSYASIDEFCTEQGTTALANGQVPSDVCKTCLKQAGWYYDGVILEGNQGSGDIRRYPSIWYTGNYLNFFPPKFVVVRKIVKDLIATQSKVRMALASFNGTEGMQLQKDFNPPCGLSLNPNSSFDSNRSTYVGLLDDLEFVGGTPLAMTLFDVGRFYHSPGLPWFGNTWEENNNDYESSSTANQFAICYSCQKSSVIILTDGVPTPGDGNGLPDRVASLADVAAKKYAGNTTTGIKQVSTTDCPGCAAFLAAEDYKNNLTRVAWYLHNFDLRDDNESDTCSTKNSGPQTVDVYTVGYATAQLPDANTILRNAANEGGGLFVEAENPSVLKQGLSTIFEHINGKSTSFSVATVSTLQTSSGHAVILPRFEPKDAPFWEGHLYRYELYSEFVNECDPSAPPRSALFPPCCEPGGPGDLDCDDQCRSAFLQDGGDPSAHDNPFFVQEGSDGFFYRNQPNKVSCSQAPMCVNKGLTAKCAAAPDPATATTTSLAAAKPWWDAGAQLKKKRWHDRKVFTVVDKDASGARDGRIDANDAIVPLDATTEASARAILPYLGNAHNRVCNTIANRIETLGDVATASVIRTNEVFCAQTVVRWVLGADVFNEAGRKRTDDPPWPPPRPDMSAPAVPANPDAVPPTAASNLPDPQQLPDRPFKLGDVFHSSPVDMVPPLPRGGILCSVGHPQCLQALWRAPSGDLKSDDDAAYDAYVEHYKDRRKIVLVGSNGGLLHAFNGGAWHEGEDDDFTSGVDESQEPFTGHFDRGYPTNDPNGTSDPSDPNKIWAEELWAFLPPDMIAKLPRVFSGEHQLLVDGSAMVRDVWADGTTNGMSTSASAWDDVKQAKEFHTVAVVGERRGGTHYFALDLTDATKLDADAGDFEWPRFLWMYPQPDDRESLRFGETYSDFLPAPPPVGPVRIAADSASGTAKATTPRKKFNGVEVPFHERWVAFLSGGYDPQYVRGRGVHMVDVWTGAEYFDFSYPESTTGVAADEPRLQLRYPIPATVGMVAWGPDSRREAGLGYGNEGFFDTATFGDSGGQLWVLRFHEPGKLGTDDRATNWFGARAFQMGGTTASLGYAHPFFFITANTALPGEYIYRAYLGTGDRYNLLDRGGGVCGPDNLRACAMRGCTVDVALDSNFGSTPELGKLGGSHSETGLGAVTTGGALDPAIASTIYTRSKAVVSACPSPATSGGAVSFTKDVTVACARDGTGRWGCDDGEPSHGAKLALSDAANTPPARNWYFSVKVFDDAPNPRIPFRTLAEAKAYDRNRLWIRETSTGRTQSGGVGGDFAIMDGAARNPATTANAQSAGWAVYYNHGPSVTVDSTTYTANPLDERTSSISGLYRMLTWNTLQPATDDSASSSGSTNGNCKYLKCSSAGEEPRLTYHYAAHPLTGASMLKGDDGNPTRSTASTTYVPTQGDQPTIFVNQKGQALVGMTVVNPNKGASSVATGDPTDAVKDLGYIEISEQTHACRHFSPTAVDLVPPAGICR